MNEFNIAVWNLHSENKYSSNSLFWYLVSFTYTPLMILASSFSCKFCSYQNCIPETTIYQWNINKHSCNILIYILSPFMISIPSITAPSRLQTKVIQDNHEISMGHHPVYLSKCYYPSYVCHHLYCYITENTFPIYYCSTEMWSNLIAKSWADDLEDMGQGQKSL